MRARVRVLLLDYKILLFSYKTNITKKGEPLDNKGSAFLLI